MLNAELKLFLHKYIYQQLAQSLVCNITSQLDVFSIEKNQLGFKARVKKGNIRRGEDILTCYNECISLAFYNFFLTNISSIRDICNANKREFPNIVFDKCPDMCNIPLFYNIVLLPDNYIQITI